jgi:GNAT superfamily N-acetyltransferase
VNINLAPELRPATARVMTRALSGIGIDARAARARLARAWSRGVLHIGLAAWTAARRRLWWYDEVRLYAMPANRPGSPPPGLSLRRDAMADLLTYKPVPGASPRQEFLARARARLGNGHHVYTCVAGGTLLHHGWTAEHQSCALLTEVSQEVPLPPRSAVLYDFYTHPGARGQGIYTRSLRHLLHAIGSNGCSDWIFIWVLAGNGASRHVIEQAGFDYYGSAFQRTVLGWVRRWSTCAASAAQARPMISLQVSVGEDAL